MFADEGPGGAAYIQWMNKKIFVPIVTEMLAYDKRKNKKFISQLFTVLLHTKNPTLDEVFDGCGYSNNTIYQLKSGLRKSDYFVNDRLIGQFFVDYYKSAKKHFNMTNDISISKVDSSVLDEIELNSLFEFKDVFDILRTNPAIQFLFPKDVESKVINYTLTGLQYAEFNHIGMNTDVPYVLEYHLVCDRCHAIHKVAAIGKEKCKMTACGGRLTHDSHQDTIRNVYASQVMSDQKMVPVISLVPLPNGEFTAATFLCRNGKSETYFALVLAVEEKTFTTTELIISPTSHAVWQLTDKIDQIHSDRTNYHIEGMDYYKAALLMQAVANGSGYKSYNILVAGKSGGAKTVTPRWYHNTFSLRCKLQDVVSVSLPGIMGSTATVSLNNRNYQIREPGLFTRYEFVILDEIYNSPSDTIMSQLKGALSSSTISKEVHQNRMEADKNASVVSTANIEPGVLNSVRREYNSLLQSYLENPDAYPDLGYVHADAYNELRFTNDANLIVMKTLELKGLEKGINWIDGQPLSNVERYALIFYLGNPSISDGDSVPAHIFDDTDVKITAPALQKIVYTQEIRDYIQFCCQIKVLHSDAMRIKINTFISKIWKYDHIHSKARGMQHMLKTLEFSAMLNGRDHLKAMDFEFVEQLYSRTCRWIEVDELKRTEKEGGPTRASELDEYGYGRKEPIPADVEIFIGERFKKYDLYGVDGEKMWDRSIVNIACDISTAFNVDDPVIGNRFISQYILKHAPKDANSFDAYVLPVAEDEEIETLYFRQNSADLDKGEVLEMLMNEFGKRKMIPKVELESLCGSGKVSLLDLNDHLSNMKRKNIITDVGDAFRIQ